MSRIRVGKNSLDADSLETWNNKITLQHDKSFLKNWEMEVPEYKNTFLLQSRNTKFLFSKIRANETNTKEFSFYALRFVFKNMVLLDSSINTVIWLVSSFWKPLKDWWNW